MHCSRRGCTNCCRACNDLDNRDFHVTIKGLCFNSLGRLLLVQERDGVWDLPGGRLEHGEDFHTTLAREVREEMGLDCEILDDQPHWAWSALNRDNKWKVVLCFRIVLPHLNFTPSKECIACHYYSGAELAALTVAPQIQLLAKHLLQSE